MRTIDCFVPVIDNFGDIGFAIQTSRAMLAIHQDWNIRLFTTDLDKTLLLARGTPLDRITVLDADERHHADFRISDTVFTFFAFKLEASVLRTNPGRKCLIEFDYFLLQGRNEMHDGIASIHGSRWTDSETNTEYVHYVPSLLSCGGGIPQVATPEFAGNPAIVSVFCYGPSIGAIRDGLFTGIPYGTGSETRERLVAWFSNDPAVPLDWQCPFMSIDQYGAFLGECEANIVRGENSLVASLVAGRPTLWDPYRESSGQEREKLEDYLAFLGDTLPNHDWTEYGEIARNFIHTEASVRSNAVKRFVEMRKNLRVPFEKVGIWIKENADLQKKLEETICIF